MLNIAYIEPDMKQKSVRYSYYGDLYAELKKVSNCYHGNIASSKLSLLLKNCSFKPDVIVFGLGWFSHNIFTEIGSLSSLDIPSVCIVHKYGIAMRAKQAFCRDNGISAILSSVPIYSDWADSMGIPFHLFKYAASHRVFNSGNDLSKVYDIGFSGALHRSELYSTPSFKYPDLRTRMQVILSRQKDLKCFLNGSDSILPRISSYKDYAKKIHQSRVWLATPSAFDDITPRYYEVCMSRTLLMCSPVPEAYKDVFIPGRNCIEFSCDLGDFLSELHCILDNPERYDAITGRAFVEFYEKHTWKHRALELVNILSKLR